jgi:hypothetical protein
MAKNDANTLVKVMTVGGLVTDVNHGGAHSVREILLTPDSLLQPGERGFNFRTVRADHQRATATSFLGGQPTRYPAHSGADHV